LPTAPPDDVVPLPPDPFAPPEPTFPPEPVPTAPPLLVPLPPLPTLPPDEEPVDPPEALPFEPPDDEPFEPPDPLVEPPDPVLPPELVSPPLPWGEGLLGEGAHWANSKVAEMQRERETSLDPGMGAPAGNGGFGLGFAPRRVARGSAHL